MAKITQQQFNTITDLRSFLLAHPDKEMIMTSCLHYLGDEAQQNKAKAAKYDELENKIAACYEDENGEFDESEDGEDLITIGEIAASHFGWI